MVPRELDWLNSRVAVVLLALLATVPLLWPAIPPLVDLPGHMGRYRVELDAGSSGLAQFFDFKWALIGNLGVDLLIVPMAKIFGLELGVKLIVIAIPALTVAALLWIAREVHGRIPPTALFALPLAYGHPFLFGFVNFALSMALALLAFALWLLLARLGRLRLRAVLFVPLSFLIWTTHVFGWGLLGLLAFSAETVRRHDAGSGGRARRWAIAAFQSAVQCLVLAPPLVAMLVWRQSATGATGASGDWFNWSAKRQWAMMTLRDRWRVFDTLSIGLLLMLVFFAARDRRFGFSRNLAASALVLLAVYLLLPRIIFGSAYADMRLTPYLLAVAIVAIRPGIGAGRGLLRAIAIAGLAFFVARIAATTASLAISSARYERALVALDHVPADARIAYFTQRACGMAWSTERLDHLSAIAIVRRRAFANDQWAVDGAQLMTVTKADAPGFVADPSQLATGPGCRLGFTRSLDAALAALPRPAFDYVWLVDPPAYDARLTTGLMPVWRDGRDVLFKVPPR